MTHVQVCNSILGHHIHIYLIHTADETYLHGFFFRGTFSSEVVNELDHVYTCLYNQLSHGIIAHNKAHVHHDIIPVSQTELKAYHYNFTPYLVSVCQ